MNTYIKQLGKNNTMLNTLENSLGYASKHCIDSHVTLVTVKPSGIKATQFISIDRNGIVTDTYTNEVITL